VWAVESPARPGWVGWWVICGDLPTDYVSADEIKHPRMAMQAIALRWRHYCSALHDGSFPGEIGIPGVAESPTTLTPLLEARAKTLADWAEDDSLWEGA